MIKQFGASEFRPRQLPFVPIHEYKAARCNKKCIQSTQFCSRRHLVFFHDVSFIKYLFCSCLPQPNAPLITRAAILLECAHFVHLCNRGQWPSWMKQSLTSFRASGPLGNRASIASCTRRVHILQRAAGKMFQLVSKY